MSAAVGARIGLALLQQGNVDGRHCALRFLRDRVRLRARVGVGIGVRDMVRVRVRVRVRVSVRA